MKTDPLQAAQYITVSGFIAQLPYLDEFLGAPAVLTKTWSPPLDAAVLAWGRKPSARRAERYAARHGLPMLYLEDGFARSVAVGHIDPPLSLILDDLGIYYDASGPSRLERLIAAPLTPQRRNLARKLMFLWREGRLSKYNYAREWVQPLPERYVLVVDQTRGDVSIRCGCAGPESFSRMLEAALDEHPGAEIFVKVHPVVAAGRKQGYFDRDALARNDRIRIVNGNTHPPGLLEHAAAVYTVTSQMGFEALLWGRSTRVFGLPFYAGWGLTHDALPALTRRRPVALENIVVAALAEYPHYRDPETGRACSPERVLSWLALQRRMRERFPAKIRALGFSLRQRPTIRSSFQGSQVRFIRRPEDLSDGDALAVRSDDQNTEGEQGRTIIRVGKSTLTALARDVPEFPPSLVLCRQDPTCWGQATSGLEELLNQTRFSAEIKARAASLRQDLVRQGEARQPLWRRPATAVRVVLVAGQAANTRGLAEELELLRAARECEPSSHLVYKPTVALASKGGAMRVARALCDSVDRHTPLFRVLPHVDAVYVLESPAGFAGLLWQREVVCYGWPFYAGWGLTRDMVPTGRRERCLNLDELVAGTLLLHTTYIHPANGRFTTAEQALAILAARMDATTRLTACRSRMRRVKRTAVAMLKAIERALYP